MKKQLLIATQVLVLGLASQITHAATTSSLTEDRTAEFSAADLDASDTLTLDELRTYLAGQVAARFSSLDVDADGGLSLDEFLADKPPLPASNTAASGLSQDSQNLGLSPFGESLGSLAGETNSFETLATEIFNLADTDADQSLNSDEFAAVAPHHSNGDILHLFAHMDKDFDLLLSSSEYVDYKPLPMHRGGRPGRPAQR